MSKIVCEICGTTYDNAKGNCPVCGWASGSDLDTAFTDMDDAFSVDFALGEEQAPQAKGKAVFDYDAVNGRRRPRSTPEPSQQDSMEDEEETGSNKLLVFILVILILALLAVSGYIAYTKLWRPNRIGNEIKPTEGVTVSWNDPTVAGDVTEATEATKPTIPCTELKLVAPMNELTSIGQFWRLMAKTSPENTTDKLTFTSGDESIVTVDELGRVTAVGEGETTIVIACGEKRIETPAVVKLANKATEAPTVDPAAPTDESKPPISAVVSGSTVLKLKRTDVTISRRGVYITLELENGLTAESVKWSTSDSSVATVYNGNVTALGKGNCVIRAEYEGQVAECVIRCKF